jgi:hypothetical protein
MNFPKNEADFVFICFIVLFLHLFSFFIFNFIAHINGEYMKKKIFVKVVMCIIFNVLVINAA